MTTRQCLDYALDKWVTEGGGIILVASRHWCMPRVKHISNKGVITHYVPPTNLKAPWHSILGFEGEVIQHDGDRKPIKPICIFFGTIALIVLGGVWWFKRWIKGPNVY